MCHLAKKYLKFDYWQSQAHPKPLGAKYVTIARVPYI